MTSYRSLGDRITGPSGEIMDISRATDWLDFYSYEAVTGPEALVDRNKRLAGELIDAIREARTNLRPSFFLTAASIFAAPYSTQVEA